MHPAQSSPRFCTICLYNNNKDTNTPCLHGFIPAAAAAAAALSFPTTATITLQPPPTSVTETSLTSIKNARKSPSSNHRQQSESPKSSEDEFENSTKLN